jgi:hypothetical protein
MGTAGEPVNDLQVILTAAIAALNLIGGTILVRWLVRHIRALEGTVSAQAKTLETVERLNKLALDVIAALDPERWAKEVAIHKELADKKVETILELEQRRLDREREDLAGATQFAIEQSAAAMKDNADNVIELLPYIPKSQRAAAIGRLTFSDDLKGVLYEYAEGVPESEPLSALQQALGGVQVAALVTGGLATGNIFGQLTKLEQHPPKAPGAS